MYRIGFSRLQQIPYTTLSFKVVTQHPYDPNPINNQGSQCIDGRHTSLAGRHFTVDIPVRNPHPTARRRINLQVFPGELGASIDWNTFEFTPLEEKVVHLAITVPGGFRETDDSSTKPHVTVLATHTSGQLLGGASIITKVDSWHQQSCAAGDGGQGWVTGSPSWAHAGILA
jgi:hypothetical protein